LLLQTEFFYEQIAVGFIIAVFDQKITKDVTKTCSYNKCPYQLNLKKLPLQKLTKNL